MTDMTISAAELAELRAAKAELDARREADAQAAEVAAAAEGEPAAPTHYAHLADGRIVPDGSQGTHYTEEGPGGVDVVTPVAARYPMKG